ncbi:MAG: tetratricopeptide repeat protein [Sphingomonadaceae bacterium]
MDLKRFLPRSHSSGQPPKITSQNMEVEAGHILASTLSSQGRYTEAIELFDKVLAIDPRRAGAWADKATCVALMGEPERALDLYDRAIQLDPNNSGFWMSKGNRLQDLGRAREAIQCHTRAVEIDPQNKAAWVCAGLCAVDLDQPATAIDCYQRAIEIDQRYAPAWINLGRLMVMLDENEKAVEAYGFASQSDPDSAVPWDNRGRVEESLGRRSDAIRSYRWAVRLAKAGEESIREHAEKRLSELEGPVVFPLMQEAMRLGDAGEGEKALELLRAVVEECPEHSVAWYYRGGAEGLLDRQDEASESFRQVVRLDPENARGWDFLSAELCKLGRYQEALEASNSAVEANRWLWECWYQKAMCERALGQLEEALGSLWNARQVVIASNSAATELIVNTMTEVIKENGGWRPAGIARITE